MAHADIGGERGARKIFLAGLSRHAIRANGNEVRSDGVATGWGACARHGVSLTLRGAGTVSVSGNAFAQPVTIPSITTNFVISAVAAATTTVTMTGTANNLGIPGCSVTIRAALTYLPPGGY